MNWFNLFKTYNLKNFKKEKLILLFTVLSIFITATLSLVVPILSENMSRYNEKSFTQANGGTLFVKADFKSEAFDEELDKLKGEGCTVTYKKINSAFFIKTSGGKFYGRLISGEPGLKQDEIILGASMAKNLGVKAGDRINIKDTDGTKTYTVKKIESIPEGLTNDETIIGYGKIGGELSYGDLVYIKGNIDGDVLKKRLKVREDGFSYSSVKDKKQELENSTKQQIASFGILTTMGYILSSAVIITTSIMLIIRRKRDISIMKLLSIKNKAIKNAMRMELSVIILAPVILAVIAAIFISKYILIVNYIPEGITLTEQFKILTEGMLMNIIFFEIFSNLPLLIINDFKGIWLLRENEEKSSIIKKRIFIYLAILIPIVLFIYSVFIGNSLNVATSLGIIFVIMLFVVVSSLLIKIFSSIHYTNKFFMYSFKNIKKNFLTFVLLIVSFSITLMFLMISMNLNKNVKDSMHKTLNNSLPYNYMAAKKDNLDIEEILNERKSGVEGYNIYYISNAKVLNEGIESRAVMLNEVKSQDFSLGVKMVSGEKLFQGEEGCLITSKYQKQNNLKIGDMLHISYEDKVIDIKIKGVYDNSIINSMAILLPYKGYSSIQQFYIKASKGNWMDKLGDNPVVAIDTLGSALSAYVAKFTNIFRMLSVMVIFASLIFNINLLNITFIEERKEETIIRALGIGKGFISKVYLLKGIILGVVSCILAYGFYILVSKLLLTLMGVTAVYSISDILILIACSAALITVTFIYPFIKMKKYASYEFLREN
ncbi:MAG: hypothetical protein Q8900_00315 [Bacillota bacterium]|nr:hypothetical protein [Bacillota bacterium]